MRYMHCTTAYCYISLSQCYCTRNRSAHYILKSLDFFDVILYFSSHLGPAAFGLMCIYIRQSTRAHGITITYIKTHGSVSCGPRSRRVTPVSILTGRTKRNFRTSVALYCLDERRRFLLWTCPPTSVLNISNLSKIASGVPEICDFKNWLSFFVFFLHIFLPLFAH